MKPKRTVFVEESLSIKASIDAVWSRLVDFDSYPEWNPFIVHVAQGSGSNAGRMKFSLVWENGRKGSSVEQMVSSSPPEAGKARLVYRYASVVSKLGLVKATRIQTLTTVGDHTGYYTREDFTGLLIRFLPLKAVKAGFRMQARALAALVESG